jgi:GntR family transcriptional regulator/MocR family aminotransferase
MEPVLPFDLALPARGEGSLTDSLHRQLRAAILDGRLAAGAPLPATRRAAAALGIARNTIANVYDLLVAEGYIASRRGAKPVVTALPRHAPAPSARRRAGGTASLNPAWRKPFVSFTPSGDPPGRSFRLGIPDHRYFPHDIWRRLSGRALRDLSRRPFSYAPTQGIPALREAIARHVAFARAVSCHADDVVVTSGAQQAFDLLARALVTPGRTAVAVEDPGYPPLRAAFAAAGARLLPVPVDGEGLCVDRLPDPVRIVSVTPSHQAPTGVALSWRRRAALLEFAHRRDAVVIEDDYDGEFRFSGRPLDALQTLDPDGRVFYVGTFSKSLFPALRKGFIVAPAWARDALVTVKQCADSHSDAITQAVLAAFIHDGHLARHVRRMRTIYGRRREALLAGLQRELCTWLEPIPSEAGLHLAARIRDPAGAASLIAKARRLTPGVVSHADYAVSADCPPALTFGYGVIDAQQILPALLRLRHALEA